MDESRQQPDGQGIERGEYRCEQAGDEDLAPRRPLEQRPSHPDDPSDRLKRARLLLRPRTHGRTVGGVAPLGFLLGFAFPTGIRNSINVTVIAAGLCYLALPAGVALIRLSGAQRAIASPA